MDEVKYQEVRRRIVLHLPEIKDALQHYEQHHMAQMPGEDGSAGSLLEVVVWRFLQNASQQRDDGQLRRGAELLEALMSDGDPEVEDDVIIGILKPLAATRKMRRAFEHLGFGDLVETGDAYNKAWQGIGVTNQRLNRGRLCAAWGRWVRR